VVVFLVLEILPGNAAQILMGPDASPEAVPRWRQAGHRPAAAGALLALGRRHAARRPGHSYAYSTPVSELVLERLSLTVPLALMAMALTTVPRAGWPASTPPRATTSWATSA
jgi:peptide/nickel transport system permease protein